ncbi:hypothetical protein [Spirillospora sp. NBC_01491]|uniref:hypothetical protein n=1 Tax=Spirillospora sp. NBC_01491 TaxID=2976007 RepID=UPI002E308018|nr:hypothetical protein [Spirillospora sp. NBC_01491]
MRYNRVIAGVVVLAAVGGCTEKPKSAFDPTPKPVRPGQAVIIAGDTNLNRDPRDGEYGLRSSAYGGGGIAISAGGDIYYRVYYDSEGRVARLGRDGKVSLYGVDIVPDQMVIYGDDLWLIAAGFGIKVLRVSVAGWRQAEVIKWMDLKDSKNIEVRDSAGGSLSASVKLQLYPNWKGAKLVVRADGVPIVISKTGMLFEVRGPGRLDEWRPLGYGDALAKVVEEGEFQPSDAVLDDQGGLVLLGHGGIIRLPRTGSATSVRFPKSVSRLPSWSTVVSAGQGAVVLLGGMKASAIAPRPTLVRRDGRMERLSWGGFVRCDKFDGSLSSVASAMSSGSVRAADGSILMNDKGCGRVYSFKLPDRLAGSAFEK